MTDQPDLGPQVTPRMAFDERETLMAYLLRHPGVFLEAKQVLTPEHFTESYEVIWAVCWRSCLDLYEQYGVLPAQHVIETDALARIAAFPGEVPESGVKELRDFIAYTYGFADSVFADPDQQQYGYDLLQKFLRERHWMDPVRDLIRELGDSTPVDVPAILDNFKVRYEAVQSTTRSPVESLILADEDDAPPPPVMSTGFEFLDTPMGGGASDGEVYGLLGTYGSGKTMLSCGLLAEFASRELRDAVRYNRDPRHAIYFGWETPPSDIRQRIISYLACIHMGRLSARPYSITLSRTGNRQEYEERLFRSDPRGEWERFNDLARPVGHLVHLADMRGAANNPKAGSGGIEEVASEIEKLRSRDGRVPGLVLLDYALVCCRRLIKARGWDVDRKLRHLVGDFGDDCRRLIAQRFNCQVWVVNQLSGQSNKRTPGSRMTHADSAEATNFAENLWYCFCLGNKSDDNLVRIDCTKTRRSEGEQRTSILRLEGHLARFASVGDDYMIDSNTDRIVKRSVGEIVAPSGAARRPASAPRGTAGRHNPNDAIY